MACFDFLQDLFGILGIAGFISAVNPWLFLLTLPMMVLFMWIRWYYLNAGRDSLS